MLAHPLDGSRGKSGISPLAPLGPQAQAHRLPPILRRPRPPPVPSCSKAPRGLFVLSRVLRIFTERAISPSPSLRQRPDRYTIRAGRNLPDKEFRYLRTVIVTAAVHWGFGSTRKHLPLTFQHWAGVSPYTSAFALAETCVFGKQSPGPVPAAPLRARLLPKLRRQLAEFLNEGSLDHLGAFTPTHLCRFAVRSGAPLPPRLFSPAQAHPSRGARRRHSPRCVPPAGTHHVHSARSDCQSGSPR